MSGQKHTLVVSGRPEQAAARYSQPALHDRPAVGGIRNDLNTMLLPLFPDQAEIQDFETTIDGCTIRMHSVDPDGRLPTPLDRKILNLLAAHVRDVIRYGGQPSRHVLVNRREIFDLLNGEGLAGGSDYKRLNERLQRLHATKIVAERSIGGEISRRRQFNWIDAFEEDVRETPGGQELVRLKISLSEDAFRWITRNEGFDMTRERFQGIASSKTSSWRIFEICLAKLVAAQGRDVFIQIDELRQRVPIRDHLRGFKNRPLKSAMQAIAENPNMSRFLKVALYRSMGDDYVPLEGRAPLDEIYLKISAGGAPLPSVDRLLPEDRLEASLAADSSSPAGALADLLLDEAEPLPLFVVEGKM